MSEENNQAEGGKPSDGLRDIPADIGEYNKFVKDGGLAHNEKILKRDAATEAARAEGILPEEGEQEHKPRNPFQRRVTGLQRKIGERDQKIRDLEERLKATAATEPNGAAAAPAKREAAEPAAEKPRVNGEAKTPPKPKEDDFKTYGDYIEALTDWKTERKLEEADAKRAAKAAEHAEADKGKAITDAHNARVDEAKTRYPEWDKAFKGLKDDSFTDPMVVFIFESEAGPDVTYYLATHREELARIAGLSPIRQAAALGVIERKFAAEEDAGGKDDEEDRGDKGKKPDDDEDEEEPEPRKPAKRAASKAPPPEKPIAGRGSADDAMPDPKDFAKYAAWAKRQDAKGVRRSAF